jgi:hypothetical protein
MKMLSIRFAAPLESDLLISVALQVGMLVPFKFTMIGLILIHFLSTL